MVDDGTTDGTLRAELTRLALQVERVQDALRIQNLMSRLTYLNEAALFEDILGLFAQRTPGVTVEIGKRGVFEGLDGARTTVVDIAGVMSQAHAEGMRAAYPDLEIEHPRTGLHEGQALASPVIEVAEDGETAKGLWVAPSTQTQFIAQAGRPVGFLLWIKFAVDFVKEEGEWRIWHYHLLPVFRTPYDTDWVETSMVPLRPAFDMPAADRPTTELFRAYSIDMAPAYVPRPPEPYTTFSDTFSY